jgi:hypothetical protein
MAASQHRGAPPQQILFAPVAPPRQRISEEFNALLQYLSQNLDSRSSEKMFGHDGKGLKKNGIARDILRPSGVLLAAIMPHRPDGDGQCAR